VEELLNKMLSNSKEIIEKFDDENQLKISSSKELVFKDKFLDLICDLKRIENLDNEEIEFLIQEFNELSKNIKREEVKNLIEREAILFPGMGDIPEKPEYSYGDYIIFHELLKFAKEKNRNLIFLMYDVTKGDWMRKSRDPHIEYIECTFELTNRFIYFLSAQDIFKDLLDINFKSLVKTNNSKESPFEKELSIRNLQLFLDTFSLYETIPNGKVTLKLLDEIARYYDTISELSEALTVVFNIAMEYREAQGNKRNRVGMVRASLNILHFGHDELLKKLYKPYFEKYQQQIKGDDEWLF